MNRKLIIIVVLVLVVVAGYVITSQSLLVSRIDNINHKVASKELSLAQELFENNNVDFSTLAIRSVGKDRHGNTHIGADQIYKNLRIITNDLIYHFDESGVITSVSGVVIDEINISTDPNISINEAVNLVKHRMSSSYILTGELGFFDLNAGSGNTKVNFTLVWKMKPRLSEYPYAIVDAYSGEILRYDDGIRY